MSKQSIAIVGASGYVGKALYAAASKRSDLEVIPVVRENYQEMKSGEYDFLINAAMPSKRFWAKSNPQQDFSETVLKTADMIYGWRYRKFIQISTVSARCELQSVYGRHKAAAEQLCMAPENLIVRLSAMYSPELSKGALVDILNQQKVFVSGESRYPFAPLDFIAGWIIRHLEDRTGVHEVGAKNTVSLAEIASSLDAKVHFEGPIENQELLNPEVGFPDAKDVFIYMNQRKQDREK